MARRTLFIAGAGHVGRAVAELALWLGYETTVWDDRPDVLDGASGLGRGLGGPIEAALAEAGVGAETAIVVVTRNVDLDVEILPAMLDTPARYVGLMGSRRRWKTTATMLSEAGVADDDLGRIRSPIGIEIGAETPEEIAVSILAEVTLSDP